jgi:hypothetical protein
MRNISWRQIFAWALAAFFVLGSLINIFSGQAGVEYENWGYPDWFHFVTGGLELSTAVLLALAATRTLGAALGCTVMIAATLTVLIHGEYAHATLPILVLASTAAIGWS